MANVVSTNYFRQQLGSGQVALSANVFNIALINSWIQTSTSDNLQSISAWSQVSAYEVSANGYSAQSLTSLSVSITPSSNVVAWKASNITWSSLTISPYGYCIYRPLDGLVVGFVEFVDAPVNAVNGDITIQWNDAIGNII